VQGYATFDNDLCILIIAFYINSLLVETRDK
jgi:hypothetical protein